MAFIHLTEWEMKELWEWGWRWHPEDALLCCLCLTPILKGKDYILHLSIPISVSAFLYVCLSYLCIYHQSVFKNTLCQTYEISEGNRRLEWWSDFLFSSLVGRFLMGTRTAWYVSQSGSPGTDLQSGIYLGKGWIQATCRRVLTWNCIGFCSIKSQREVRLN